MRGDDDASIPSSLATRGVALALGKGDEEGGAGRARTDRPGGTASPSLLMNAGWESGSRLSNELPPDHPS
jgi:hypothetical protein